MLNWQEKEENLVLSLSFPFLSPSLFSQISPTPFRSDRNWLTFFPGKSVINLEGS